MIASEESGITGISEGQEEIEKIKNGEKKEKKKKKGYSPIKKVCFSYNLIEKKKKRHGKGVHTRAYI